ncbi:MULTISPECIES: hypothetical protein [Novosphingobium]|nr:hypothetical protein [Novosphingobium resinovorum]
MPEMFGAIADGITDCSDAFEAALKTVTRVNFIAGRQRNLTLILGAGAYRLTRPLIIPSAEVTIVGSGAAHSALLVDHLEGHGMVCSSAMNLRFAHFSVIGAASRRTGGTGDGLVILPGPNANFTFRMSIEDVSVSNHPGNGICIVNPEGLTMVNVNSFENGKNGCVLDSTGLENICNYLDFTRFSNNGQSGLKVKNVANSIFSRVECLNNKGSVQFDISGRQNTIVATDCECFNLYDGRVPYVGLKVSGRGHVIQHGVFFKLSTAIQLSRAKDCRIVLPFISGIKGFPVNVAVDLDVNCSGNVIDMSEGDFIVKPVSDPSGNSVVLVNGRDPALAAFIEHKRA